MAGCDSHVHVVGPADRYPQLVPRDHYLGPADIGTLRRLGENRGISRFVIVQPSFYGTDNSAMLDTLAELGALGRGVAVVDAGLADSVMLRGWHRLGVRGLRINLYSPIGGPKSFAQGFSDMTKIARTQDWHVEVIASLDMIGEHAKLIAQADVPVVIDHYGVFDTSAPDSEKGRMLLDLLRMSHVWIKLSAPYRVSTNPVETRPHAAWLAAILDRSKERCVWGSDWPHTPAHDEHAGTAYRKISYAALFDDFIAALPSEQCADAILRHNPSRLYGFADNS